MRNKSVVAEAEQIRLASELIELGARLQLLQQETDLSRERLIRLYKEIRGTAPSKGMLPYSTEWFMTWSPNIHASLFMDIHEFLAKNAGQSGIGALVKSYRLYLEHLSVTQEEPVLSITRAWFLVRFFEANMLQLTGCTQCGGRFVVHTHELCNDYVCGICRPPSRAGKVKRPPLRAEKVKKSGFSPDMSVAGAV